MPLCFRANIQRLFWEKGLEINSFPKAAKLLSIEDKTLVAGLYFNKKMKRIEMNTWQIIKA